MPGNQVGWICRLIRLVSFPFLSFRLALFRLHDGQFVTSRLASLMICPGFKLTGSINKKLWPLRQPPYVCIVSILVGPAKSRLRVAS